MALEQELQEQEAKAEAKQEEEVKKNIDDLTDEEIEAVKELSESEGRKVLLKCMEKRVQKQKDDVIVLAKDNFLNPKPDGYTYYEILGAFMQGMGEMERLVKVLIADPEEVRKAQEALKEAERMLTEGK